MALNFWEFALLGAAAYVASVTLARMMRRRRDALIDELTQEAEAEQQRLRAEARLEKRRKMRETIREEETKSRRAA